jgi:hypothetical protein
MNEIIAHGELTLDEHVERIQDCLQRTRESIFETVIAISECKEQLGDSVFQVNVAEQLGMNASTLNRWLSIGNSTFIMSNQENLPSTFSSLYNLTQVEKKYEEFYSNSADKLQELIEGNKVGLLSQQNDIQEIQKQIDKKIKAKKNKAREANLLSLGDNTLQSVSRKTTLDEVLSNREVFRTIVVTLDSEQISKWGDDAVFEEDIAEEFPLHDVRSPSTTESVVCLIKVPIKKIDVGIKVLNAFAFNYRDCFVPQDAASGKLQNMSLELVVVRGTRGANQQVMSENILSAKTDDILDFCESNFSEPMLLVFDDTERADWVIIDD